MGIYEGYTVKEVEDSDRVWKTGNNLIIRRNGRCCVHAFTDRKKDNETREEWKERVIRDFFASAYLGSGNKEDFLAEREGWIDAKELWDSFYRSYRGLKRLDPDNVELSLEIGRKELESRR